MKYSTIAEPFRNKIIGLFIDLVHRNRKYYWASDLLDKDLSQEEIRLAIKRAYNSCKQSGIDVDLHFKVKHFESDKCASFDDCKLSQYGYLLTIINADPKNENVAQHQKLILENHLQADRESNVG